MSREPKYPGGLPKPHCRACTAARIPAPSREFPYMSALNDILGFGWDEIERNLCPTHRRMLDRGQEVLNEMMANYAKRQAS